MTLYSVNGRLSSRFLSLFWAIKEGVMSKYEIRPLSESRKADIVRTVLSAPAKTQGASISSFSEKSSSGETVNGMLNRAFRAATKR